MSTGMFEALEHVLSDEERGESYDPGGGISYIEMAMQIVQDYLESGLDRAFPHDKDHLPLYDDLKLLEQISEPQVFLDTLVHVLEAVVPEHSGNEFAYLLTPLIVGTLYECGHDGLTLDLKDFPAEVEKIGMSLAGTEEKPLSLILRLPGDERSLPSTVAPKVRHCALALYGNANTLGTSSASSEFIINGTAIFLGIDAEGCVFRLPQVKRAHIERDTLARSSLTYRVEIEKEGFTYHTYLSDEFFSRGNRLLIPQGDGWQEVTP